MCDLNGVLSHSLEVEENEAKEGKVELGLEDGEIIVRNEVGLD